MSWRAAAGANDTAIHVFPTIDQAVATLATPAPTDDPSRDEG
jgi:hypothetical protein